jgi:hypothetical protein
MLERRGPAGSEKAIEHAHPPVFLSDHVDDNISFLERYLVYVRLKPDAIAHRHHHASTV